MVAMATLDANTAVETLLAAIHLERSEVAGGRTPNRAGCFATAPAMPTSRVLRRYRPSFQSAGLLSAADVAHLDHEALVSLGITATGHRKRILRLVSHVQRRSAQRAPAEPRRSATDPPSSSSRNSRGSEEFGKGSAPGPAAALKPVPKPRTVFNRRRTAPVHFRPPPPDAVPSAHRRLSQESICFPLLDGTGSPPAAPVGGTDGTSPPVPPRVARQVPLGASSSPSPPAAARDEQPLPASRSPTSPGCRDDGSSRWSVSSAMEMISNDIYWGTAASAPPTPPRQAADGNRRSRFGKPLVGSVGRQNRSIDS